MALKLTDGDATPHSARVRRAGRSDAAALGALHAEATSERLEHRGGEVLVASMLRGADAEEASRSFARHLDDDHLEVLIAELAAGGSGPSGAGEPLGHAVIRFPHPGPLSQHVAVIEELYVTPPARNVGLGSVLLEHAKAVAVARGCTGLDAVALPGDRTTKNFFEDHAMVARAIIVHTELQPAEPDLAARVIKDG